MEVVSQWERERERERKATYKYIRRNYIYKKYTHTHPETDNEEGILRDGKTAEVQRRGSWFIKNKTLFCIVIISK